MKLSKKYVLFLAVLVLLTPIGILLPHYCKSNGAWGEWSVDTVAKLTGYAPEGMKKQADSYSAPIADYDLGKPSGSLARQSFTYILSGVIGVAIIVFFTFAATKLIKKKQSE